MISIIIPVYNESKSIDRTLKGLPYGNGIEVIVVDGQSDDQTMGIVNRYPVKCISSSRGRAQQMNAGASVARGDILLFLHADCVIDADGLKTIEKKISYNFIGGCFSHKIDSPQLIYRWIELSGNLRAEMLKIFYGDQAIFVRRDIFDQIGGFENVGLFEDVIFSKKLRRLGKTIVMDHQAVVLPRRWQKRGVLKTTVLNWFLTFGFNMGVSTEKLAKLYKNVR